MDRDLAEQLSGGEEPFDPSVFDPTGPVFDFDAYHFARGFLAVMPTMDAEAPALQVEIHETGAILVGTDTYSCLTTWVPFATPDAGWEETEQAPAMRPANAQTPLMVFRAIDDTGLASKWCAYHAKLKRAKTKPKERVYLTCGVRRGEQPMLDDGMAAQAVRFSTDDWPLLFRMSTEGGVSWQGLAQEVQAADVSFDPIRMMGHRLAQLGAVANLATDKLVDLQVRTMPRGDIIVVRYSSFPAVTGWVSSARD